MTTAAETRDIGIEAAAHAMRNATDRAAVGMSMRGRRDLAALAYDAILRTIANDLRAEGDRLQKVHEQTGNVLGFSHALSFGDAATWLLSRRGETAADDLPGMWEHADLTGGQTDTAS